jgi:hypothetical protein
MIALIKQASKPKLTHSPSSHVNRDTLTKLVKQATQDTLGAAKSRGPYFSLIGWEKAHVTW